MTASRRQAPAFQLEVRAPLLWRHLHGLIWMLALAAVCLALASQAEAHAGPAAAAGCGLLGLLASPVLWRWAWRAGAHEVRQLLWDGEGWSLRSVAALDAAREDAPRLEVEVDVALDLGGFLLLACRPLGSTSPPRRSRARLFLPVARRHHPDVWRPLRWALFSARHRPYAV